MADAPTAPEWVRPGARVMIRAGRTTDVWSVGTIAKVHKRYCTVQERPTARFMYDGGDRVKYWPPRADRFAAAAYLYAWDAPEAVHAREGMIQRNRVRKVQDAVEQWANTGDVGHAREALAVLQRAIEAADEQEAAPDVASAP